MVVKGEWVGYNGIVVDVCGEKWGVSDLWTDSLNFHYRLNYKLEFNLRYYVHR